MPAAFRIVAALQLLAIFAQAVFAGGFMDGAHALRAAHAAGGLVVLALAVVQLIVAVLARRREPGSRTTKLLIVGVLMLGAVVGQLAVGGSHLLAVHVPLALLLFGGALWCTSVGWSRRLV